MSEISLSTSSQSPVDSAMVVLGLNAVILAVHEKTARVLIVNDYSPENTWGWRALPSGPFEPTKDRTLNLGLRRWVHELSGLAVGYVEQLYTFGNKFRDLREIKGGPRYLSVSYLGLTHEQKPVGEANASWRNLYDYFPWEDWRDGRPAVINDVILPALDRWCLEESDSSGIKRRRARVHSTFGNEKGHYDFEKVLERFELLYDAGLVLEAHRDYDLLKDHRGLFPFSRDLSDGTGISEEAAKIPGIPLVHDHRRILASALGRVRGKIKYRPIVFELMPEEFTLLQLQHVVEALSGDTLHKQNFRRLMINEKLVEETGRIEQLSKGRPAALFRFREHVTLERPAPKSSA